MSCIKCNDPITGFEECETITCTGICNGTFHITCAGVTARSLRKMKTDQLLKSWSCNSCKQESTCRQAPITDNLHQSQISSDTNLMEFLKKENESMKKYIQDKFDEYEKSLEFNSELIKNLTSTITNLKVANEDLRKENTKIKDELRVIKTEIADLQQYSRRNNLEISNLPETENEKISDVLNSVFNCLEIDVMDKVSIAHRVPTANKAKPKPIIVQFTNRDSKNLCLKAAKSKKITASQIDGKHKDLPIFFNEHLIPSLKEVFYHCRKFKTENNFKFAWVKDGKIFIRKNENSRVIRIANTADLLNVDTN